MTPVLQAGTRLKMKAIYAGEGEIIHIGEGLMACSLKKEEWTHAAHFAAALWLMRYRTDLEPAAAMPGLIRAFNEAVGGVNSDTAGYHETITLTSLRAACGVFDSIPAEHAGIPDRQCPYVHQIRQPRLAAGILDAGAADVGGGAAGLAGTGLEGPAILIRIR